jgi:hypothetical protein
MTSYTITGADLAVCPLILAADPGGPVHLRWTGPSRAHEIYVPGVEEVLARLLQAADAGGHHIDVQLADGGTLRVGQRGLDDGVRISHAPTGAEWEFDTVTTQQLTTALLSTAHS